MTPCDYCPVKEASLICCGTCGRDFIDQCMECYERDRLNCIKGEWSLAKSTTSPIRYKDCIAHAQGVAEIVRVALEERIRRNTK